MDQQGQSSQKMKLTSSYYNRYAKQIILKKIGLHGQKKIANSIQKIGHKNVNCFKDEKCMEVELIEVSSSNDFIIFLGAGSISKKARSMEESMLKIIRKN